MNASRTRRAALYVRVSTDTPLAKGKRSAEETGCEHEARHAQSISRSVHVKIAREAMDRGRAALTVAVGSPWCTARLPETGGSHGDGYTRRGRAADGDCVMSCCRACEAGLRQ